MTNEIRLNVPGTVITCGESKLVGEVVNDWHDGDFGFLVDGEESPRLMKVSKWNHTYPAPKLPTEVGTVIESGGVRFMRHSKEGETSWPWAATKDVGADCMPKSGTVLAHIEKHGGFKILLQGTPTGGKGTP